MITILAEKPSVAREIARIAGATRKEEGFYTGNGYHVTWALGHLVQPALPEGYGFKGFSRDSLPVIPEEFMLIPRQVKTDKGYKADAAAVKQIKVITKLWNESDGIIVATDCAREGQDTHRRGNDRSADGRKDGDARRVQEQAGQAIQRCGDF